MNFEKPTLHEAICFAWGKQPYCNICREKNHSVPGVGVHSWICSNENCDSLKEKEPKDFNYFYGVD